MTKICLYNLRTRHVCTSSLLSSAYSAYKNGRMVAAGGRPNVAIGSAVARCQLRYHALFFTESLPLFHAKQNKYACVEQNAKKWEETQHHRILWAWIRLLCTWHLIECTVHLLATSRLSPTYTLEVSGSPGTASLHTRLGKRAQIKQS